MSPPELVDAVGSATGPLFEGFMAVLLLAEGGGLELGASATAAQEGGLPSRESTRPAARKMHAGTTRNLRAAVLSRSEGFLRARLMQCDADALAELLVGAGGGLAVVSDVRGALQLDSEPQLEALHDSLVSRRGVYSVCIVCVLCVCVLCVCVLCMYSVCA